MFLNETVSHRPPLQQLRQDAACLVVHHINSNSNLPKVKYVLIKLIKFVYVFVVDSDFIIFEPTHSNMDKEGYIQQITSFKLWIYR